MVSGTTTWFIHGNILEAEAVEIVSTVVHHQLNLSPTPINDITKSDTIKVGKGKATVYQQEIEDPLSADDTYLAYYQIDTSELSEQEQLKKALLNSLVCMYLEEPFKVTLKTE